MQGTKRVFLFIFLHLFLHFGIISLIKYFLMQVSLPLSIVFFNRFEAIKLNYCTMIVN